MPISEINLTDAEKNKILAKYLSEKEHDILRLKIRKNFNFFEDFANSNFMKFQIRTNGSYSIGGIEEWSQSCSVYKNDTKTHFDYDKDGNGKQIKYNLHSEFEKIKEYIQIYSDHLISNYIIIKKKADASFIGGLNCLWIDTSTKGTNYTIKTNFDGNLFLEQSQNEKWNIIAKYNSIDELFKNHTYLKRRGFCCIS